MISIPSWLLPAALEQRHKPVDSRYVSRSRSHHAMDTSAERLARAQAEHRKQGTRTDLLHDNIMKSEQGTGRAYLLLLRLARNEPDILPRGRIHGRAVQIG
jgi:hypothetical protein